MTSDIKEFISTCEACRTFEVSQQKETLIPHDIPDRPWDKVGCDLFQLQDKQYLVTVDYYSTFWEVDCLESDTTANKVIKKLKNQFARHGIPEVVVSDNGPQFKCEAFKKFSNKWDFNHVTSSPGHSRGNGKAEAAVKVVKNILKKTQRANKDPYLGLLEYRNTPTQDLNTSPAQRLFNRRTRSVLPMSTSLLEPRTRPQNEYPNIVCRGQKIKDKYDRHAKDLPVLKEGDAVRVKPFPLRDQTWKKGTIVQRLSKGHMTW